MDNFEGFEADGNSVGNRILKAFANSLDPDETPQNMAREQLSVRLSDRWDPTADPINSIIPITEISRPNPTKLD
ncbi:hypothetical protein DPMN_183922 [Dreissena polymorpha]|uniref:Uncharacterized protein n=1 Tax=Dreissena polymorpha TaxID=45954 RepID=A0A9D4I5Y9_DREPO|nr:hypothetical protein DPMN_183922 [Dreissena polymorpha]